MLTLEPVPITVRGYSGKSYADRPVSFIWEGKEHRVVEILKTWLEPGKKFFLLTAEDGKRYELCYNEGEDQWLMTRIQQ